jgi:hypothetical protein
LLLLVLLRVLVVEEFQGALSLQVLLQVVGLRCPFPSVVSLLCSWLTYVEDKMDVFEIVFGDRVRFGMQLLKGEAQIWWRGMQAAHSSSPRVLTWDVYIRQFERRFYPVTFLER